MLPGRHYTVSSCETQHICVWRRPVQLQRWHWLSEWLFKKTTKCCDSKLQDQIEVINNIKSKGKQSLRNAAAIVRIRIQGQPQDNSLEE